MNEHIHQLRRRQHRLPRPKLRVLFALVFLAACGLASQAPGSPLRLAAAQPFSIQAYDGFKDRTLPWNITVVRNPDGTVYKQGRMVMTVTRPDASTVVFEQLTDLDGNLRGQLYGSVANQNGTYTIQAQVAGGGELHTDTFQIVDSADPAASTTYTGNNTFTGTTTFSQPIQANGGVDTNGAAITTDNGNINAGTGTVTAASFTGNGSGLTSLNGSNISTGTVADARLTSNVTLQGNTFNGANQLVQLNGTGGLPALNGSLLTNLNASNVSSGSLADGRLSSNVALLDRNSQTFTGNNQLFKNTGDSANAFQVQNAAGTSALTVDTVNSKVIITNLETTGSVTSTGSLSGSNLTLSGSGPTTINLTNTTAGTGLTIGGDTNLYRSAADTLKTDDSFQVGAAPTVNGLVLQNYGGLDFTRAAGNQTALRMFESTAGVQDANARWQASLNGDLYWGAGGASAVDTNLYRSAADTLKTDDAFTTAGMLTVQSGAGAALTADPVSRRVHHYSINAGDPAYVSYLDGDADARWFVTGQGQTYWGDGTGAFDTNLYRAGASDLRTDDYFSAAYNITAGIGTGYQVTIGNVSGGWTGLTFGSAQDTNLYRAAADTLQTDDNFTVNGARGITVANGTTGYFEARPTTVSGVFYTRVSGEANYRFILDNTGAMNWGPGGGLGQDTNLYRAGADTLKTGDQFQAGSKVVANADGSAGLAQLGAVGPANEVGATFNDTNLYRSAADTLKTDDKLAIATLGTADTSTTLCRNTALEVATCTSSEKYKHDIEPLGAGDYGAILQKVRDTDIYNYRFNGPDQALRTGVIAEHLPGELTPTKDDKGNPTPDWFSIYGYLWAGERALADKVDGLERSVHDLNQGLAAEAKTLKVAEKLETQELRVEGDAEVKGDLTVGGDVTLGDGRRDKLVDVSGEQSVWIWTEGQPDGNYGVDVTPSWQTTYAVTERNEWGFRVEFAERAPDGATIDWLIFR